MKAEIVAQYFLSKDPIRKNFTIKCMKIGDLSPYEGNIRLNKYLYFAQVLYLARFGKKLFTNKIYAYINGPIIREVRENFYVLYHSDENVEIEDENKKIFLDKVYDSLENATTEELIDMSHEDYAWLELKNNMNHGPEMNISKFQDKYREKFAALIKVLGI